MNHSALLSLAVLCISIQHQSLSADENQPLVWRGCGISKTAFMEACANAYEEKTGIKVQLSGGGATLGIEAAASGGADLGGTCRACLAARGENRLDIQMAVVAWDALVVVVHKSNPIDGVTREQLRDVLQQRITNWKQLGGRDQRIVVTARRGKTSGVGYSTRLLILGDVEADYGRTVLRLNSSGPVERLVARQPRAIAVTGVSSARKRPGLKVLKIDGHDPTPENIAAGTYPYFRPLYVAYKPNANAAATTFVKWLLGEEGQKVVETEQTVTLKQGAGLYDKFEHFQDKPAISNRDQLQELARQVKDRRS